MNTKQIHRIASALAAALALNACGSDEPTGPPPETLEITTTSLPDAVVADPYSAGIDATGGEGGYTWEMISGTLPTGLTLSVEDLDDSDLLITGMPETQQTRSFTLRVRSEDGQTATQQLTLRVLPEPSPLTVENLVLPPGLQGAQYSVPLRAEGGDGANYEWSVVGGQLPAGLSISNGRITGNPSGTDTTTVTLRVESGGFAAEETFQLRVVANRTVDYHITIVDVTGVPASIQPHLAEAIAQWESVLAGDLGAVAVPDSFFGPDGCGGFGQNVNGTATDDILMLVHIESIDGPGKTLAQAGPCGIRNSNALPFVGILTLDQDDLMPIVGTSTLTDIIAHEMGHVLGYGTLWEIFDVIEHAGTDSTRFTGPAAISEWEALGGSGPVPLENDGGEGTADGHWEESIFDEELMTGFVEAIGLPNPLSRLTIGSLEDLGYAVNYSAAESYSLSSTSSLRADAAWQDQRHLGYDVILRGPIRVLDDTDPRNRPRR